MFLNDQGYLSLAFISAILIHELGHLIFIFLFRLEVSIIAFKVYGINIRIKENQYVSYHKDLLILIGGSLANFLFAIILSLFLHSNLIYFIITNILIAIFNLLPVESLDGGKIIYIILLNIFDYQAAYSISFGISLIFTVAFCVLNFFMIIYGKFNITLTILCIMLLTKVIRTMYE